MLYEMFLHILNTGILAGLITLTLLLLRPVLLRLLTAQQRVVLWMSAWMLGYFPLSNRAAFLPVTFQDLLGVRTGSSFGYEAAFLPAAYEGAGTYSVNLPGKVLVPVELTDALMYALPVLWAAGMAALVGWFLLRNRKLNLLMRSGRAVTADDSLAAGIDLDGNVLEGSLEVWLATGLPTSFVRKSFFGPNAIAIQSELSYETQRLVLLHERRHVALWHPWWKVIATVNLVIFWWNPMVWFGFRYFCRDMELACDDSVMKRLKPEERRRYAEILVELGQGSPLLDAPLAFGECDAAVRVKTLVDWKPRPGLLTVLSWCAAILMVFFLYGGHRQPYPAADLALAFRRDYGNMEQFRTELNDGLADALELYKPHAIPKPEPPDMGIVAAWEAPAQVLKARVASGFSAETGITYKTVQSAYPSLWVETSSGWYRVYYLWWGEGSNTFHVSKAEACDAPDVSGAFRVL